MCPDIFWMQAAMERQGLSVSVSGITAQVTTPTVSPVIAANSTSGNGSGGGSSGTPIDPIIGAAVGGAGGVVLAGLAFFMYRRYKVCVNILAAHSPEPPNFTFEQYEIKNFYSPRNNLHFVICCTVTIDICTVAEKNPYPSTKTHKRY
jgi:hypothetical protein